jgi:putative transposase
MRNSLDRLKILQKRLSKKKKGSNNSKKYRHRVNRLHEKIANRRNDDLHKITHRLAKENQFSCICVEDLNIIGMTASVKPKKDESGKFIPNGKAAKSGLNLSILDAGIGNFYRMLEYKCRWNGINLIKIGRFEPSSKMCSGCGEINQNLTLADREWTCACGAEHDRDLNAAVNIRNIGLRMNSGEALPGGPAKPPTLVGALKQEKLKPKPF